MPLSNSILDHPVVVFIILIAALLRWLSQRSEQRGPDPERPVVPDEPIPRSDADSEEERVRRFLEALGRSPTSTPPPKVIRRAVTPKAATAKTEVWPQARPFHRLPPLTTMPPPLPTAPEPFQTAPISPAQMPSAPPTEGYVPKSAQGFEVHDYTAHLVSDTPSHLPASYLSDLLRLASIQDLRRAIILREVLGPPRGLRPLT